MDSRDKFAQMLTEGYKALDPDREEREYIRELLRQREQQRKKRIRTITALAAAFLIVIGAVFAVGGCIGPVEADKNDKTKVEKQGESVIISDENADGQEVGSESIIETDWNKIDKLKDKYPDMITFTDIPEGMEFVSVEVNEGNCNMLNIKYCFKKSGDTILVLQECYTKEKQQTQLLENTDDYIDYKNYTISIEQGDKELIATAFDKKAYIDIIGNIDENEVFDILDKIKAP